MSGLEGKVAIVTGAARGIGLGYAQRLAREGAMVALADLDHDLAEEEAARISDAGGRALGVSVDVSDEQATKRMAEQTAEVFGGIDILVNNAAIYASYVHYLPQDLPLDYWQKFLDVNLTGVLLCCRAVLPFMRQRGRGRIVNQSSAAANAPRNQYGITKLGVQGITISLARSLAKDAITVNCIAPGITDTEATRGHYSDEQLAEMVATKQLVGRPGTPEDMAAALMWLVGDESDFVTGQVIRVDGGYVMHPRDESGGAVTGTLENKVAIVTGAAQGIGEVYAKTLAREGAAVALVDVKIEAARTRADEIVQVGGRAVAVQADVSDPQAIEHTMRTTAEEFGGIDILVNNGAIYEGYQSYGLEEIPLEYWDRFLDVNATGVLLACQAVVPYMRERGGGRIVNQSSTSADLMLNQYGLTKLLVQGLTTAFAHSLGPAGITVNAIAPGPIATQATLDKYPVEPFLEVLPIKRMGTPDDLAEFLAFLVSDRGEWITGQTFHINGGFWMRAA